MRTAYRRFLYLDSEEVLNALACLEGGDIESRTDQILSETEGGLGLKLSIPASLMSISAGGQKRWQILTQMRRKRTTHSAVAELLDRLQASGDLRAAERETTFYENELIIVDGEMQFWPYTPGSVNRDYGPLMPLTRDSGPLGWLASVGENSTVRHRRELGLPESLTAVIRLNRRMFALMTLEADYVVVRDAAELTRSVTVVGQVGVIPRPSEKLSIMRIAGGLRATWRLTEDAIGDRGLIDLPSETNGEVAIVRPLCIFK